MNPVLVISGLLVLAYFGSMVAGGRAIRGFGLPSGSEFLLVGIFIGPKFMGLVSPRSFEPFAPLVLFSLAWVTAIIGAHYGFVGERAVSKRRMGGGILLSLVAFVPTSLAAFALGSFLLGWPPRQLLILALATGAVSCETTRHAVRWVNERYRADGPLSNAIAELAEADDVVPLAALAVAFALIPQHDSVALPLATWVLVLATVATGAAMGATCAALFDVEPRPSQRWGILFGGVLLTAGIASRLGLSGIAATFVLGLVTSALTKRRGVLFQMLSLTERAVMLPALVLSGIYVTLPQTRQTALFIGIVVLVRVGAKITSGHLVARSFAELRGAGTTLGLGLTPAGLLTTTVGLACALRFQGPLGDLVLALAVATTMLGEVIGPAMLHRALRHAGEIDAPSTANLGATVPRTRLRAKLPFGVLAQKRRRTARLSKR